MNNIYKVIWSKAKNCYVVASEIAKSHTKSASGSEKMGGYGKRALLALAAASAIFCGGLVNVGASVQSETISAGTTSNRVLTVDNTDDAAQLNKVISAVREDKLVTKDNIGGQLTDYAKASDLSAKADANDVYSKTDAKNTFATKTELGSYATRTELDAKANTDLSNLTADGETKIKNIMSADMEKKANKDTVTALGERVGGVEGKVTNLETQTGNLSTDGKSLTGMDAVSGTTVSGDTVNAGSLNVTGEISNGNGVTTTLEKINASMEKTNQNADKVADLEKKTSKIDYDAANDKTTINGVGISNTQVDMGGKDITNARALTATGKVTGDGVDAGTGAITGGSLTVTGKVTGNGVDAGTGAITGGSLSVTGDTTLKKTDVNGALTVTDASDLQGDVILGKNAANTVTVNGTAHFNEAVNMDNGLTVDKGLNVTSGESSLKNTTVGGTLDVTGATTLKGTLTAEKDATFEKNVTVQNDLTVNGKLNVDKISMKNDELKNGKKHDSATTITADEISNLAKVTEQGNTTESQFTHNEKGTFNHARDGNNADWKESNSNVTADGVSNKMTDSDGNRHTYYQTATESKEQLVNGDKSKSNFEKKTAEGNTISITEKDAAGNVVQSLTNKQTVKGEKTSVTNEDSSSIIKQEADQIRHNVTSVDGKKSSTEVKADGITNTSDGTITNDANHIENKATTMKTTVTGKATESYGELETTVDGQATENFNGGLDTNVTGTENHTVTGDQNIHVTKNQTNQIDGNQENIIGGSQTTTVTGDISNKAKNITNEAETKLTDKVGTNTRVIDSTSITDTVGTTTNRKIEDGKITDTAGDFTVTTDKANGTTFAKTGSTAYSAATGAPKDTNIAGNLITTGRVDANELGVSDKDGANTADFSVEAGVGKGVKASAGNGTTTGSLDVTAKEVGSSVKDDASGKGSTFKQRIDAIMGNVKTDAGESEVTQKGDEITSKVGLGEATNSRVTQKKDLLEAAVTDGTNYNISNDTANESAKELRGGTKVNRQYDNLNGSQKTITNGTYTTSKLQTALDITNTAEYGTITNDAKDIVNNATGDMTNTVGGKLTTTVTGQATENFKGGLKTDITGEEIHTVTGNQTNKVTGKQTNTVEGGQENIISGGQINNITGDQTTTISGTQTTTATDINRNASSSMVDKVDNAYGTNTETKVAGKTTTDVSIKGTGEEGKYIRGANESRDYLIKGTLKNSETKTAEATSTEITDGTNKASTIQKVTDLAGSVTNGKETGVSGIHANKDGSVSIDSAVTDGTNTSVQNQTASQIAAAVKDGAGNENASVANATASANTIKSGSKANTVISTADGTSFINSDAMTPVTGASGVGTAKNTTIKGNTITTGKVTMDYADVMKDLGVRGNANITGKTTTGSLEVTGTSTLKGDVTMGSNATVNGNFTVNGTTNLKNTNVVGKLDVTQEATFHDSVSIAKDLSVGGDVTANSYKVGDKTYIDKNGIHANGQKITDVADGSISEGSKDAVNGGQLYTVKNDLEGKVNKVGANAAAMANLHPMEFDPDSKWNIAAAIGNYGSETAAALGAFYRPNDDVMVNLSTAFGTGENMVGGGVSVRLGKGGNKLSREENNALKDQVNDLTARMDALLSVLNPNMSKDFPDVPENHWAYEAVSRLAGNDIVQGYPDGEFHGERTMTRYEMAEIIYNALSRGAEAEKELVEEFKPELQAMAASEKATAERAEG